jgi:uncharacterized 2Fe-2S/4Fe-4S cluster protein (DUF4445 family)
MKRKSTEFLTRDEIRRGYVLACQVVPTSDLVVEVPPESRLGPYEGVRMDSEQFRDLAERAAERPLAELDPVVVKLFLVLRDLPMERIRFIGNSSVAGAKRAILSRRMLEEVSRVRERITYQELMVGPAYMEKSTSACFVPHTDLAPFPSVAKRLNGQRARIGTTVTQQQERR